MSLKIRLARAGTKKRPHYHIVIADSRSPRDGRFIERLGNFNPLVAKDSKDRLKLDLDKVKAWLAKGAQPTETVRKLLVVSGAWEQFESTRPARPVSDRYARPGRATSPAKKAPAKKAPAKKAVASKSAAAKASAAATADIPAGDSAGDGKAES